MSFLPQQADVVSGDQYRYALTNFRIAHEKVEEQRKQLEEQEKQVALLRDRIALLEGTAGDQERTSTKQGGSSVDDFSIKNAASQLERLINRWAAEIVRSPPASLNDLYAAAIGDLTGASDPLPAGASPMQVQNILRHAMSEVISSEVINVLMVTNSADANVQLTRIHEHLFSRNPVVAGVWRRQTFSAAVESCSPELTSSILSDQLPMLIKLLAQQAQGAIAILAAAYGFSRTLHGSSPSSGSAADAFYRSFVPEIGSQLYARQIELVRRCMRSERGEVDRVGATIFPGLVKVSRGPMLPGGQSQENVQTVVRRAQVMCECALSAAGEVPPSH
ncbi:hypothetical protein PAXINDRAFT_136667 [Paxillus involutus ATCC 200175]|uniref:Uncharacterized protein n=1 Tax=Paxillus involutus ATCC 200175 TaxID=664439 RepID=A0A0C9TZR9_PAXIN|nr:hypothetical protein PAXINDRAFT_136667 [Paxillus involutus ATCC 200175]